MAVSGLSEAAWWGSQECIGLRLFTIVGTIAVSLLQIQFDIRKLPRCFFFSACSSVQTAIALTAEQKCDVPKLSGK